MPRRMYLPVTLIAILVFGGLRAERAVACPFCSAVAQTFTEEIDSMDVVVVARLLESPPVKSTFDANDELPKAKFEVIDILKGQNFLGEKKVVEAIYFGGAEKGKPFLLMAVDPPRLSWSTPLALTPRSHDYLKKLVKLPRDFAQSEEAYTRRMEFFLGHLEDADDLLARDAYDEFARAPYAVVQRLKPKLNHDQLVSWIKNPDVPASRRVLYLTMLGICGGEEDMAMLEEMLKSDDKKQKAGLNALIACYLMLKGPSGMPLIEQQFLMNEEADYPDTYAAIMALRFHGTEVNVIPQQRILEAFRLLLERPKLADLVIADLARWEDWQSTPRLVQLFKESDEKTSWVRVPVINFLRRCPLPEAQVHLKELEKLDPVSFRRAAIQFPFAAPAVPADTTPADTQADSSATSGSDKP
jgi:hypothetical protein